MTLDPALTADEEDTIRLIRSLQAKQAQIAEAEATAATSAETAKVERANAENLRREFADRMHERGITNPDALLRGRD